jgi:hypothetical protein
VQQAQQGYARDCKPIPAAIETWRVWFVDQRQKLVGELFDFKDDYRGCVRKLDWQEALNQVTEAWQLQVVISVHCGHRFNSTHLSDETTGTRVNNMLARHECSAERRNELHKMVNDFVRPCSGTLLATESHWRCV